jgi:hypothetical protein
MRKKAVLFRRPSRGTCIGFTKRGGNMRKRLIVLLATLVVAGVIVGVAAAVSGGSQKFDLLGPDGNAFCDGSGVLSGQPDSWGFAVINFDEDADSVLTSVSAKGLQPNTTYNVLLIQGDDDCFTPDGSFTTNGQGKGSVSLSEESVSDHAFVAVCGGAFCGDADSYVTQTYSH